MGKVIQLRKPRSFTSAERMIEEVREEIFRSGITYDRLADRCHVSKSTVNALASGKTRWPRPTTLFPLLIALGLSVRLEKK